ncbi:cobalt-precorrin-5B (C(1))-methyltransferase [Pseudoduganella albidiflava]|uniref:Cobalt-precorrin-5B C(1)-methyltransferase n=1 Tax=Pseudoduganella albidiflava TaxID=321983 RepID=A0A411X0Z5_9BURK|nr:cobalt-precorrin-5B (C(1))-methyltransferase [Pseudoduganella albidiflava]QBI02639.1 cobalt-precorrin-5B (C(1))-methyltransferase [Pseudoduganella albidiflava]GGY41086.1 cobalt-precorrin-5B C(1)-methyltransferase [Pseudoduganella albidiflava]
MKEKAATERGTRTGFTTGACAAAAARAAMLGLATGRVPEEVEALLPNGSRVVFAVHDGRCGDGRAHAMVIKFAGDDPDCTDGAHLTVDLRLLPGQAGAVTWVAGDGVGTVTMKGLGLEVGGPAINPVPRKNIADNLREAAPGLLAEHGIEVTISVPDGQVMAKKTTNARLGILGGISILGTTGIVKPYSTAAWRASVVQGVQVASTAGHGMVALTTGGRTETFAMATLRGERPALPAACFVQMGDFLRYALDEAVAQGIGLVVLAVMVGKLTKIAQGETITHANRSEVDTDLVAEIGRRIGASAEDCAAMAAAETARFGAELMVERGLGEAFHRALAQAAIDTLTAPDRYGRAFQLRVLVCDFTGELVADVWSAPALPRERPASAGRTGVAHIADTET